MQKAFVTTVICAQVVWFSVEMFGAVPTGSKVTLTFPKRMLTTVVTSDWSVYGVEVACEDSGCTVNGQNDWQTSGSPWLIDGAIGKTFVDKKTTKTVVEVTTEPGTIQLVFPNPADVDRGLAAVTLKPGESADEYRAGIYLRIAKTVFIGDLAGVPAASQSRLLAFAEIIGSPLAVARYKEGSYLVVNLGDEGNIYNTLQMNQLQRVARSLREHIVPVIKPLAGDVSASSMSGVKVSFKVNFKSFLEKHAVPSVDNVVMYVPAAALKQFADADISSQKLLDSSAILVNDDRVEISLAE